MRMKRSFCLGQLMDNGHHLVTYDFECLECKHNEERIVRRRELGNQTCSKCGGMMEHLFPQGKKWGEQYPMKLYTVEGEPVANSPAHYKRILKERGLTCVKGPKGGGWS